MKKTFLKNQLTASIAAVTALSVFRGVPTFADDNDVATAKATGETSAKVSINKVLNIAEGITTPEATFTFTSPLKLVHHQMVHLMKRLILLMVKLQIKMYLILEQTFQQLAKLTLRKKPAIFLEK